MNHLKTKPLGHKSYGSIPHFRGSRVNQSDSYCEPGQQKIMTEKTRDRKDLIIVQEKLDGSNCSIARIDGGLWALTRNGYLAKNSPYKQHHEFVSWASYNCDRFDFLKEGERLVGEWMSQACGTIYDMPHEPFVAFDIMTEHNRVCYHDFLLRVLPERFTVPKLVHIGQAIRLKQAVKGIEKSGHGAIDPVEGLIYRCEREGTVDFLGKWVRPDKKDGIYLPEISGKEPIYNSYLHTY